MNKDYNYFIKQVGKILPNEMNDELKLLTSQYFKKIYDLILTNYSPIKNNVVFGICTKTRPYYNSRKWKTLINKFDDNTEFIVLSNAGIIPMQYSTCFPFLEYDAAHTAKNDLKFQEIMVPRLNNILNKHQSKWKNIIFLIGGGDLKRWIPIIEELKDFQIKLLPSIKVYEKAKNEWQNEKKYKGSFNYYPLTHPYILNELSQYIPVNKQKGLF